MMQTAPQITAAENLPLEARPLKTLGELLAELQEKGIDVTGDILKIPVNLHFSIPKT